MAVDLGDALLHFVGNLRPLDNAYKRMEAKSKKAGATGTKAMRPMNAVLGQIKRLVAGIGIAFVAWKLISIFKNVVTAAGTFQSAMNRVRALTGATGEEFTKLNAKAKELGATTEFTAGQVADAMGFMAQAGFSTTEIYESLNDTLLLASAAQLDLATSADIVTNVMAGFGITSEGLGNAVDVLTKSFTSANTDLSQLAQAMRVAGPVAKSAGQTFEETAAALALMGNAGFQGSLAGIAFKRAMINLQLPTGETKKAIEELGIQTRDTATGKMLPFIDILEQIEKTADPGQAALRLFGARAGPALQTLLTQGSAALREMTTELDNVGGTAARIAKIQMEGFRGATKRLQSAWEALQIAFADAGILDTVTALAEGLAKFARSLADMDAAKWAPLRQALKAMSNFAQAGGLAFANIILPAIGLGLTLIVGAVTGVVIAIQVLLQGFAEIIRLGAFLAGKLPFLGDRFKELAGTVEDVAEGFSIQLDESINGSVASLGELVDAWRPANEILAQAEVQSKKTAEALDDVADAANRVAEAFKFIGPTIAESMELAIPAIEKLSEKIREELVKRALKELNDSLIVIGVNVEEFPEKITGVLDTTLGELEAKAPAITDTFKKLGDIGKGALNNLEVAFKQAALAAILSGESIGEAMRKATAAVLASIAAESVIEALRELARGFAALFFNPAEAASHFKAAALFTATAVAAGSAASAVAPRGQKVSQTFAPSGEPTGVIVGEAEPITIERRLAEGGLITRPTLALLGEQGPELVVPLRKGGGVGRGRGAAGDGSRGTTIQMFIEGIISADNLEDVMAQMSDLVENADARLGSSTTLRVVSRE